MEPAQFKSLVESVNDFLTGKTDQDELAIAEEMVGEYLDLYFADTVNEDVADEDIQEALFAALELAEAIELFMELKMPKLDASGRAKSRKVRDAYRVGAQGAAATTQNRNIAARHHAGMAKNKKDYPNPNKPGAAAKEAGRAKSYMKSAARSSQRASDRARKAGM